MTPQLDQKARDMLFDEKCAELQREHERRMRFARHMVLSALVGTVITMAAWAYMVARCV